MDVHASLRFLRMSPRKVRLVVDAVRGLPVREAETRLSFMKKDAALPVLKLLRSAMANAEHNFKLNKDDLRIRWITADGGPTLKRSTPRAFGRAAPIRKRTTHIEIILAGKEDSKQEGKEKKEEPLKKEKKVVSKKKSVKAVSEPKIVS